MVWIGTKGVLFAVVLLLITILALFGSASSQPQISDDLAAVLSEKNPKLATVINGQSIDDGYIRAYLGAYNYFSDIPYEVVLEGAAGEAVLAVGNQEDNIKGFEIEGKRYAIHLMACDYNLQRCSFRVNGVSTGGKHADRFDQNEAVATFDLDDSYRIKINSITFDYCDNKRFCNLHYEAYDVVNVSVIPG